MKQKIALILCLFLGIVAYITVNIKYTHTNHISFHQEPKKEPTKMIKEDIVQKKQTEKNND